MNNLSKDFLDSLKSRLDPKATSLVKFITEKTFINGKPFSFEGHGYQRFLTELIEDNPGFTFVVRKCSQIGLSENLNRVILARMALRPGEGVLISFPSIKFSNEVIATRINDVITQSPTLNALRDKNVDSSSTKKLGASILYGLSGKPGVSTALLNRPISLVFIDEADRQDPDVYSSFRSRMTHVAPNDRLVLMISTPTAEDVGIDAEFKDCRIQYFSKLECPCGHTFDPDYYKHVHIPGFTDSLKTLTKLKAASMDLTETYLACPECDEHLTHENAVVIYEKVINEEGTKKRIGLSLTPFVAMSFITMPDLVESSVTYTSVLEFTNQGLGKTSNLKESSIPTDHIVFEPQTPAGARIAGIDMGKQCHFISGVLKSDTTIHIDTVEVIKLSDLEGFLAEFFLKNPTAAAVMDQQPYADIVYRLVRRYPRLFSAIYVDPVPQPPHLYKLKLQDKHGELVRQITITRNKLFDLLATSLKDFVTFQPTPYNNDIVMHLTSLRRIRDYRFSEMVYRWQKPKNGEDHFMHSLAYLYAASKLALADFGQSNGVPPLQIYKMKNTGI